MRLSPPIRLSQPVTASDIFDIAKVRESTLSSSDLAVLRFGKIPASEVLPWVTKSTELELIDEFKLPRIASSDDLGPDVLRGEHLVVRDLDLLPNLRGHPAGASNLITEEGQVVAHAEWMYIPAKISPDMEASPATEGAHPANPPPPGANVDLIAHFNELIESKMAQIKKGVRCYELRNISTAASHLRKGIAKQLVLWIVPYADRDNIPVVLAASPAGYGLYKACGFEDITDEKNEAVVCAIDMSKWGGEGLHYHRVMVRWPSAWTGSRNWQQYKANLKGETV